MREHGEMAERDYEWRKAMPGYNGTGDTEWI